MDEKSGQSPEVSGPDRIPFPGDWTKSSHHQPLTNDFVDRTQASCPGNVVLMHLKRDFADPGDYV